LFMLWQKRVMLASLRMQNSLWKLLHLLHQKTFKKQKPFLCWWLFRVGRHSFFSYFIQNGFTVLHGSEHAAGFPSFIQKCFRFRGYHCKHFFVTINAIIEVHFDRQNLQLLFLAAKRTFTY